MRPWLVWILFAVCLAVVLAAMGWASVTVLRLDDAQAAAQEQALLEESVRLALWRMDSALAPLVARESTWPYFAYASFYPARRAYTNMLSAVQPGEILMPSPLLSQASPHVLLHFQIAPAGGFSSPQVPEGPMRDLAVASYTTAEALAQAADRLRTLRSVLHEEAVLAQLPPPDASRPKAAVLPPEIPSQRAEAPARAGQQVEGYDLAQRQLRQQQQIAIQQLPRQTAQGKSGGDYSAREYNLFNNAGIADLEQAGGPAVGDVREGMSAVVWIRGQLFLARRVIANGGEYIQGAWLDWPSLERFLLEGVRDLLPDARLEPIAEPTPEMTGQRILAALPVRLIPGRSAEAPAGTASPLRLSLAAAWAGLLLAGVAVAVLLAGALSLSERRGAFVSAVTHEMRTPLTTFRMYTEMLNKGMVPAEKRTRYLDTLRLEADRLAHLVENVLSYARLERNGLASRSETTTPAAVFERSQGRLADRAEQCGMTLRLDEGDGGQSAVRGDPGAIEQILFNLVDNACKYAARASDRTIDIRVRGDRRSVAFEVADRGPGVDRVQQRKLFRPFSKSAQQAAHSAPGVGLGLALSRRLARQMGGDLTYRSNDGEGATFTLHLPRA